MKFQQISCHYGCETPFTLAVVFNSTNYKVFSTPSPPQEVLYFLF